MSKASPGKAAQFSLCSLGKAVQGAQCPLPAEGPHRWAPGLLVGLLREGLRPVGSTLRWLCEQPRRQLGLPMARGEEADVFKI